MSELSEFMLESEKRAASRKEALERSAMGFRARPNAVSRVRAPVERPFLDCPESRDPERALWIVDTAGEARSRGARGLLEISITAPQAESGAVSPRRGDLVLFWRRGPGGGGVSLCSVTAVVSREIGLGGRGFTVHSRATLEVVSTFPGNPMTRTKLKLVDSLLGPGDRRTDRVAVLDKTQANALVTMASEQERLAERDWEISPGTTVRRRDLHRKYGGDLSGPISRAARRVFLFLRDQEAATYGDPQIDDEGRLVIPMTGRTEALVDHIHAGRATHVFQQSVVGRRFTYLGEGVIAWDADRRTNEQPSLHLSRIDRSLPADRAVRVVEVHEVASDGGLSPWSTPAAGVEPAIPRGLRHHEIVADLKQRARTSGYELMTRDAAGPDVDVAWFDQGQLVLIEVKSGSPRGEAGQVRTGLGQLLEYSFLLEQRGLRVARRVLYLGSPPEKHHWVSFLERHGCGLAWPGSEGDLIV